MSKRFKKTIKTAITQVYLKSKNRGHKENYSFFKLGFSRKVQELLAIFQYQRHFKGQLLKIAFKFSNMIFQGIICQS